MELCQMQDSWLSKNADEIHLYADCKGMKNVYCELETVYGPTTS